MRYEDVVFLEVAEVVRMHARFIQATGGASGLRDRGLLEAAVMAPRQGYILSFAAIAASYAHGLAKNHAFVDGNKRVAIGAALLFLGLNEKELAEPLPSAWESIMNGVADGSVSCVELERHFVTAMPYGDTLLDADEDDEAE